MISLIWAMDKNRCIGKDNKLPWKLKADMKRFVQLTKGKPVIMGRKTYESIGKALPKRTNIIITFDKNYKADNCIVAHSIEDAIELAESEEKSEEIMIIGGSKIYEQFLPKADRLYITIIDYEFEGDTFFPEFDMNEWKEVEKQKGTSDQENDYNYTFLTLEKK